MCRDAVVIVNIINGSNENISITNSTCQNGNHQHCFGYSPVINITLELYTMTGNPVVIGGPRK